MLIEIISASPFLSGTNNSQKNRSHSAVTEHTMKLFAHQITYRAEVILSNTNKSKTIIAIGCLHLVKKRAKMGMYEAFLPIY